MNFRKRLKLRMKHHIALVERNRIVMKRLDIISKLFYNQIHHTTLGQPISDIHWGNNIIKGNCPKMIDSSNHGLPQLMTNEK